MPLIRVAAIACLAVAVAGAQATQTRPRGRALGIPFPGKTGPNNAITDVAGIAVGHATIIQGDGVLVPGKGPIRTGVTAILPRPKGNWDPVFAATFNLNGNGDMTGINWIKESGFMEGPILLTGTHSVGTVRDAAIQWQLKNGRVFTFTYPIVAETYDFLNDANGEHVKAAHAFQALDAARTDPCRKAASAAARAWAATDSRAASGRRRRSCNGVRRPVHARRARAVQLRRRPAHPRRADQPGNHRPAHVQCAREAGAPAAGRRVRLVAAAPPQMNSSPPTNAAAPSSSSSRPTRRCCRINSNASAGA